MCRDDPQNDRGTLRIEGEKSRNEACRYLGVESYPRNEPRIINKERKVGKKREEFERERVANGRDWTVLGSRGEGCEGNEG